MSHEFFSSLSLSLSLSLSQGQHKVPDSDKYCSIPFICFKTECAACVTSLVHKNVAPRQKSTVVGQVASYYDAQYCIYSGFLL